METLDLRFIAEENDLEYIETTTANNGYPESIKGAVIGFETFQEAKSFANENDLEIKFFEKRDGWNLWYRSGSTAYEELSFSAKDYGDDYEDYFSNEFEDEAEFIEAEMLERLIEFSSFEEIERFVEIKRELWDELISFDHDEIVITCCGEYYTKIKKKTMRFSHDTHTYAIGCIEEE